jgi:hypothetical protein
MDVESLAAKIVREQIDSRVSKAQEHSMEVIEEKIQTTVSDALQKYDNDKTGEADFALESVGGSVLSTRGTKEYYPYHRRETLLGVTLWFNSVKPRILIQQQSQTINAGECWGRLLNLLDKFLLLQLHMNIFHMNFQSLKI